MVKTATYIGAAALVIFILLFANGYFRSNDSIDRRSQPRVKQEMSEAETERLRIAQESERKRKGEQERELLIQREEERLRLLREAEQERIARQKELQGTEQERPGAERQSAAQGEERKLKAQEGIEAERLRLVQAEERRRNAQEEVGREKQQEELKQCFQKAEEVYAANWERACRQIDSPPRCLLPPAVLARFDGGRREAKEECDRLYSMK